MKPKQIVGKKFGRLTVSSEYTNEKGDRVCRCVCDCGKEASVQKGNILSGKTRSCGCLELENKTKYRDLSGMKFGRLTALAPTKQREDGSVVWECVCDCGKKAFASMRNLTRGHTKSCGCVREVKRDIKGKRFGRLTALHPDPEVHTKKRKWICQCDCGNACSVSSSNLKNGHTRSCGCLRREEHRIMVEGTCLDVIASDKINANNRSGVRGVSYQSRTGKWIATINLCKRHYFLGAFEVVEDAAKARRLADDLLYRPIIEKHQYKLCKRVKLSLRGSPGALD